MLTEFEYMKNTFLFFSLITHDFLEYVRQTTSKLLVDPFRWVIMCKVSHWANKGEIS